MDEEYILLALEEFETIEASMPELAVHVRFAVAMEYLRAGIECRDFNMRLAKPKEKMQ